MSDLTVSKKTILVVDDVPENIDVLSGILSTEYTVKAATSGERALKIANSNNKPDVILLDVMMPEMDGYEVCRRLKTSKETRHIPVMFVTAKDAVDDTVLGFELGAVDYITKPVSPAIVKARVKNVVELREGQQKLQVALDTTLTGSIELMMDVLSLTSPIAFGRSRNLRRHVSATAKRLGHKNNWTFEIAAMLSQLGCITLPAELLERIDRGQPISDDEQALFENHPQVGKRLLQKIPNLKDAAEIIGLQNSTSDEIENDSGIPSQVQLGASLLQVALHMDDLERKKTATVKPEKVDIEKKEVEVTRTVEIIQEKDASLSELVVGMTIMGDINTRKGMLLIKAGTEVSRAVIERLKGFSDMGNLDSFTFKVKFVEVG